MECKRENVGHVLHPVDILTLMIAECTLRSKMTRFVTFDIFYSCKSIAMKFGTQFSETRGH